MDQLKYDAHFSSLTGHELDAAVEARPAKVLREGTLRLEARKVVPFENMLYGVVPVRKKRPTSSTFHRKEAPNRRHGRVLTTFQPPKFPSKFLSKFLSKFRNLNN